MKSSFFPLHGARFDGSMKAFFSLLVFEIYNIHMRDRKRERKIEREREKERERQRDRETERQSYCADKPEETLFFMIAYLLCHMLWIIYDHLFMCACIVHLLLHEKAIYLILWIHHFNTFLSCLNLLFHFVHLALFLYSFSINILIS